MASNDLPGTYNTVVAIDRDKNSQFALKWSIDHLLSNNNNNHQVILAHVKNRNTVTQGSGGDGGSASARESDADIQQIFLPFRGFCARKGVSCKEVVLEDVDIAGALSEYVNANCISNIVVGASSRNAFTRKFRNPDVPTGLVKSTPEFCAVYVIAKGKVMAVRSATRSPPLPKLPPAAQQQPSNQSAPESAINSDEAVKTPFARLGARGGAAPLPGHLAVRSIERAVDSVRTPPRERPFSTARSGPPSIFENVEASNRRSSNSNSRDFFAESLDFNLDQSFSIGDFNPDGPDFSLSSDSPGSSSTSSTRDVEAEMKRLKLELKQTMDMYSKACKEALSAKQKAQELHQWKLEEARKSEEARLAGEQALQLAEMEKAKAKAAIEAAEVAQRVAEIEAKKRMNAEIKAKIEAAEKNKALDALNKTDVRYRKYSIEEIETATDFFSESLKIGEGGYGPVYRATLDHTPVAIKVLRPDAAQGKKQFQQEVEVLSCIRHPNMVLLLGACPEYGCLVYEYMDNGSLEDRLFRRGNTPSIPWRSRFKIAAEIATGLLFLHQAKPEPLVHRDLKPANILLDRNYVSKISDVGLARLVPPSVADNVTQYRMTSTAGTFCYIDPEYQQTGMLGIKSDIYSLGVVLLQLVTAKPPMGLTHHVERAMNGGTMASLLDPTVPDWPTEEVLAFVKLALRCTELRRKDRPDLGTVILPELNRFRNLGWPNQESISSCSSSNNSRTGSPNNSGSSPGLPRPSHRSFINNSSSSPHSQSQELSPLRGGQDGMVGSPGSSSMGMPTGPNSMAHSSQEEPQPQWRPAEEGGVRVPNGVPTGSRVVPKRLFP